MNNRLKIILSLCDLTGNWPAPYEEAGYEVLRIDLANGQDVRSMAHLGCSVYGILAAPPCTVFCKAGAWTWRDMDPARVLDGLSVVDACLRAVAIYRPAFWALENPSGRLQHWLGPPKFKFQPHQFGDPWTKRTYLWGDFIPPLPLFSARANRVVKPVMGDITTNFSSRQKVLRSATPTGFAMAFFEANP